MAQAGLVCVPVETPEAVEAFCVEHKVSMVVVGPEVAILSDLKTRLESKGIFCFAPSREVARLESSKLFCKEVLKGAQFRRQNFS